MFPPGQRTAARRGRRAPRAPRGLVRRLVGPLLVPALGVADLLSDSLRQRRRRTRLRSASSRSDGVGPARRRCGRRRQPRRSRIAVELPLASTDDLARPGASSPVGRAIARRVGGRPCAASCASSSAGWPARAPTAGRVGAKSAPAGSTAAAFPTRGELARCSCGAAIDVELPFKLTAGLHHAVRTPTRTTGPRAARLPQRAAAPITRRARTAPRSRAGRAARRARPGPAGRHPRDRARRTPVSRALLVVGFGCCGVTDPIGELDRPRAGPRRSTAAPDEATA